MPGRPPAFNLNDLIKAYVAGEALYILASRFRIGKLKMRAMLTAAGIALRSAWHPSERRKRAAKQRLARMTVAQRKALTANAHKAHDAMSAGNRRRWANMTPAARAYQVSAANNAVRGVPKSLSHKMANARTIERTGTPTLLERSIGALLQAHGYETAHLKAIGPYNCDLVIDSVAVEIWAAGFHSQARHRQRDPIRTRYLLNRGWHVLIIRIAGKRQFTTSGADDIVAFLQAARDNPAMRRQYRVIWGTGQFIAAGCVDDDQDALVAALHRAL